MANKKIQVFNDGIVTIYSVDNIAEKGNKPKEGLTKKVGPLRYQKRTVGMSRYWTAMQAQVRVDQVIRVPQISSISTQEVAIPIDGLQYKIVQIQHIEDVQPPSMDLSLERIDANYDIN